MGQVNDTILARIKKLLALSASSNEHEAALAASKAQDLMFQHGLEMSEITAFDLDPDNRLAQRDFDLESGVSKIPKWKQWLFTVIGETSFCKPFFSRQWQGYGKRRVLTGRMIGRKADVEIAQYLYSYLTYELERLSREYIKANPEEYGYATKKRRSWLEGAASTVSLRLREDFQARMHQSDASFALVVNNDAAIDKWLNEHGFKFQKSQQSRNDIDDDAYYDGRQAGRNVSLRAGIKTGKQQANLLR